MPYPRAELNEAHLHGEFLPLTGQVVRGVLNSGIASIDEALFLGGLDKGEFLRAFGADIYFDDQTRHVEAAAQHVSACHVPHGVANE